VTRPPYEPSSIDPRTSRPNRRVSREPPPEGASSKAMAAKLPGAPSRSSRVFTILRALLGGALVVGLSGTVAWAVRRHIVQSPRFAVTEISVSGQHQRTVQALLTEADLAKGVNVFTVDLDRARARLLADPWIQDAALGRRLPGTLLVQVVEREIGALVVLHQPYLVSRDGVIFKRFELGDPTDLPVITGLDADAVADDREGAQATLRRALDLAIDYERSPLGIRSPLQEIHVTSGNGFTLVVGKDGVSLALGRPPFRRKLEEATRVTAELDRRGARAEAIMLDDEARPERVVARTR
jgi:cell division protein FtsQ